MRRRRRARRLGERRAVLRWREPTQELGPEAERDEGDGGLRCSAVVSERVLTTELVGGGGRPSIKRVCLETVCVILHV